MFLIKLITAATTGKIIIMERKTLIISKETHQKLKEYCNNNSIKLNDWVEKLILNEIKKYDGK